MASVPPGTPHQLALHNFDTIQLNACIDRAASYLVQATQANGRFEYRISLEPGVKLPPKYNILRHIGATYALARYCELRDSPESLVALQRQVAFIQRECFRPVHPHEGLSAIWSDPQFTSRDSSFAKLGAAGLGLAAWLNVERVRPGTTEIEDLRSLGRFILFMQKANGDFYSKFMPDHGGRSDSWRSLYYPGEAILGLVLLHEHDPHGPWLEAAARGMAFLATSRQGKRFTEADHWALLATQRLWIHRQRIDHVITETLLRDHATKICRSILAFRYHHPDRSPLHGCFGAVGLTAPTATRLEGLQAALPLLDSHNLRREAHRAVAEGIGFTMRAQVRSGPYSGGIPRALATRPDDDDRAAEVRIDYVQHALSAWLQFAGLSVNADETAELIGASIN